MRDTNTKQGQYQIKDNYYYNRYNYYTKCCPQPTLNIDLYTPKTAIKSIINPEIANMKLLYAIEINKKIIITINATISESRTAPMALKNDASLPKSLAAK